MKSFNLVAYNILPKKEKIYFHMIYPWMHDGIMSKKDCILIFTEVGGNFCEDA